MMDSSPTLKQRGGSSSKEPQSSNGTANPTDPNKKEKKKNFIETIKNQVFEIERIRNKFISHEFHKLDRTRSRIGQPKTSSDTESESDSEAFLQASQTHPHRKLPHQHQSSPSITPPAQISASAGVSSAASSPSTTPPLKEPSSPTSAAQSNGLFSSRPSLLSSESKDISYRGLINLLVLLLIFMSFRLVILNHLKYGFLLDIGLLAITDYQRWPGLMIGLTLNFYIIASYLIELSAAKSIFPGHRIYYVLRVINCFCCVVIPSASIIAFEPNPASGIIVMIMVCIYSMKIISYAYENSKQRNFHPSNAKFDWNSKAASDTSVYPFNLSLKSTYWYMLVPTLVYQLSYPRSPKVRLGYLFRRIFEALFLSLLIFWMVGQYMVPLVQNSLRPMEQYDLVKFIERVMKLSLPNLLVWLLGFYVFFHLYLNIVAEITRFGDREFYRDWWNSTGLDYFWRTWNMPVHHWMVVLIYTPMRRRRWSKNWGYFMCFFVSAIFHELVISVPFHTFKLWAFFGIMSQMVLIALTKGSLNGQNIGNIIFWITIVLGQPLIVLLYYRNFIQENPSLYPPNQFDISSEGLKF